MIRVGIADDHQLFVDGLKNALSAIPDLLVVLTAASTVEIMESIEGATLDVLLLDLDMPVTGGLTVLEQGGTPPTIVVSMHADAVTEKKVLAAGAKAFLPKSVPLIEVAATIRAVAAGEPIPTRGPDRQELLTRHSAPRLDPGAESLTEREREILQILASGVTATTEIAEIMFISPKTVKNHLAAIFSKLAVADRTQAALEAIRLGIAGRT